MMRAHGDIADSDLISTFDIVNNMKTLSLPYEGKSFGNLFDKIMDGSKVDRTKSKGDNQPEPSESFVFDAFDFSEILDNQMGGVIKLPLSIPIYYDENDRCQPMLEHIFYDRDG